MSTPYQSSYYESIDFKFCEGDYVTEDTNPDKFSFDHVSGDGSYKLCAFFFAFSGSLSV